MINYHVWDGNPEIAEKLGFWKGKDGSYYKFIESQMEKHLVRMAV